MWASLLTKSAGSTRKTTFMQMGHQWECNEWQMHTNAHYDVPTELDHCLRQTVSVLGLDQLASSVFFGVKASQDCESLLWIWSTQGLWKLNRPCLDPSLWMKKPVQCFEKSSLRDTCPLLCFWKKWFRNAFSNSSMDSKVSPWSPL